jgi:hypothetical protein
MGSVGVDIVAKYISSDLSLLDVSVFLLKGAFSNDYANVLILVTKTN